MKDKTFSEKIVFYGLVGVLGLFLGQNIAPKISNFLNRMKKKEHIELNTLVCAQDTHFLKNKYDTNTIISFEKFTISKNGSLMKDLKISRDEAFQIARQENLEIGIDSCTHEQYPIIHENDVFVHYTLQSGVTGWYKDKPEYVCLTFEDDLDK